MWYSKLVVSCACLLLLHLKMGAARATNNGPSEALYALARDLGLGDDGLEYIWRTGMPWVITNKNDPNDVTTVTYTLGSNRHTISRRTQTKFRSSIKLQGNWASNDPEFFFNPFLNPFGIGSSLAYYQNWASSFSNFFVPCCQGYNGYSNPNNPSPPPSNRIPNDRIPNERIPSERFPNERIPNERNPSARPPNERPEFTPNRDESNSNDSLWVPSPEVTTKEPFVPLPTGAPSHDASVDTVIDDYLAKVDVTTADIKQEDGEYVTTIVDKNGRILKAKFELVENKSQGGKQFSN